MIKKLQKKFISITAAALFTMILLVLAAVNGIFYLQTDRHLEQRLDTLMSGHLFMPPGDPKRRTPQGETPQEMDLLPHFEDRLRIRADGCVICLDASGNILEIRQDAAESYSQEELAAVCAALLEKGKSHGWYQYFKFRIALPTGEDGQAETLIGLINASSDLYSVFTVLLISAVIGVLSFLFVLLIIIIASRHAVKPIAESYARQKQFVTDAGHELKTPLTVISANSELARMIYGDSEWFDSIDKQVGKMNSLVRSLITLAKMDEEQKPVFSSFDLSDAVYDTAKSFEELVHSHGKLITFDIADNIQYSGDESRMRQVVSILMDNAAKYCDRGGKIAVKLFRDRQIHLQIINDYADIKASELDKVFERFYRADKARTPDGSYGLGLSIAKSIVELHRGEIRARALDHGRIMFEVIL